MDIFDFLEPVDLSSILQGKTLEKGSVGKRIKIHSKDAPLNNLNRVRIAILGVPDNRESVNSGCELAPDRIRRDLYGLFLHSGISVADIGNLRMGPDFMDSVYGIREVAQILFEKKIFVIILGGNYQLTYGNYLAYEAFQKPVNIVSVNSSFHVKQLTSSNGGWHFIPKIILQQENFLFNYSAIGYQTYFTPPEEIEAAEKLFFDISRLGNVQGNIEESEPVLRDADIVTFNIGAVKSSEAPGSGIISPNGFTGKEVCQLARYAGMSDRLSSFGLFEVNPETDMAGQTTMLAAQIIWHLLDGISNRKKDYPASNIQSCIKFHVDTGNSTYITFYKSAKSDRWWMEIPHPSSGYTKKLIISCSKADYDCACRQEVPDRWWRFYQKIS